MKAMIWKEWRENFKWAVLGGVGLALATLYTLSQHNGSYIYEGTWQALTNLITIGCPILATALGFLQIFPEQRRDQWAFLMHRPASRGTIFAGKVSAGLCLYLLAVVPTALGINIWAALPGHLGMPYEWRIGLQQVADVLTGVVFYFAAILTALRPARWYGSRALGLGAALLCATLVVALPEFWKALLTLLFFILILMVTAWGSFLTDGTYNLQPKVAKAGLGTTLFAGNIVVTAAAFAFIAAVLSAFTTQDWSYQSYRIDQQGRVLRVTNARSIETATDLSGKPVKLPQNRNGYGTNPFLDMQTLHGIGPHQSTTPPRGYRDLAHYFLTFTPNVEEVTWFYVYSQRRVLGYRHMDNKFVGYLGPDGFSPPDKSGSARFASPLYTDIWNNDDILRFSDAIYRVDVNAQRIILIAQGRPGEIRSACHLHSRDYNIASTHPDLDTVALVVNHQIEVFSSTGELKFTTPLQFDAPNYPSLQVTSAPESRHYFFMYSAHYRDNMNPSTRPPDYVGEVSSTGQVLRRYTLPPLLDTNNRNIAWTDYTLALGVPPLLLAGIALYNLIPSAEHLESGPLAWPLFIVVAVITALLCAAIAWRIGRRCGFNQRGQWAWNLGVFGLGAFGLLLLLAIKEWPARQTCPHCGQQRLVNHEHCEHCGAEFPQPAPDGTEIFEPAPSF